MLRILTAVLFCGAAFAQLANSPANLDFRSGVFGDPPPGWINPTGKLGFPASITDQCRDPGSRCAVLRSETVANPAPLGNLMQTINAVQLRNKLIRFRASVRVESSTGGRAQLWVRVDRPGGQMGFFDNMQRRPIVSSVWQEYEINGEVAADATLLNFGLMLIGGGAAYLDAVSLDVVGEVKVAPVGERSRPLAGRGLENLTAFARLFGYIRHFHPSDEAARADWTALAIAGIAAVENASDSADLARRLQAFFRPVAPTASVFPSGETPPALDLGSVVKVTSWLHKGYGTGSVASIYKSERVTAEALNSGATPQWIRYRALSELLAGVPRSEVAIEIEPFRNPSQPRKVTLARTPTSGMTAEPRPEKIAEPKPGIYYIDLSRITDADWKAALPKLEAAKGIIFDKRGYPRVNPQWLTHLSKTPIDTAQWHVPLGKEPDRRNLTFTRSPGWNLHASNPYLAARKAILTDGRAISYAESTLGIIEHYKLAEIVGSATAGTNGNTNPFSLPGGYTISWTGMKVLKHDGSTHHGVGIAPTIPAGRTRAGVAAGRDEVLERALSLFN